MFFSPIKHSMERPRSIVRFKNILIKIRKYFHSLAAEEMNRGLESIFDKCVLFSQQKLILFT